MNVSKSFELHARIDTTLGREAQLSNIISPRPVRYRHPDDLVRTRVEGLRLPLFIQDVEQRQAILTQSLSARLFNDLTSNTGREFSAFTTPEMHHEPE